MRRQKFWWNVGKYWKAENLRKPLFYRKITFKYEKCVIK